MAILLTGLMAFLTKKMLIEVRRDILEQAINDANSSTNDAAIFLSEVALAVKRGKHIVYVPALNGDIDLSTNLKKVIGKNAVALLQSSQRDRSKFWALTDRLNTKAVCSYDEVTPEGNFTKVIHIDPSRMMGFEIGVETHVIGENISDVTMFDILFDYYASSHRLKDVSRCFYPLMGGGDTTCKVYENECEYQYHFCLVITDSDFKLPCEEGKELENLENESTAGKVLCVHNKYQSPVSVFYPMRYVSEIENLIPKDIYKEYGFNNKQSIVLDHDYSFYDMKKGLDFYRLRKPEHYDYWTTVYAGDADFSEFDSLSAQHETFASFRDAAKGKFVLPGWGYDILKNILDTSTLVKSMRKTKRADLSESQHKEWIKIGEIMFNWTCALEPRYA